MVEDDQDEEGEEEEEAPPVYPMQYNVQNERIRVQSELAKNKQS